MSSKFLKVLHFGDASAKKNQKLRSWNLIEMYLKSGVTIYKMHMFQINAWRVMLHSTNFARFKYI